MSRRILVFSGTTEGKNVALTLARRGWQVEMCVATEYGEKVLPEHAGVNVRVGRLEQSAMEELIRGEGFAQVIDATHPYAAVVSENIKSACDAAGAEYLRLLRGSVSYDGVVEVADVSAAVDFLNTVEGNVLVTTGSKELAAFTQVENYKERIFARVLSTAEVCRKCAELGFEGKNLFAMQGPFSEEMNTAMLRQVGAKWLVTKESGASGGFEQKLSAARKAGARVVVIRRPTRETGYDLSELLTRLTGSPADKTVYLVGIGMGGYTGMTLEAIHAFESAELIIGAGRMLEAVAAFGKKTVSEYRSDAIVQTILDTDAATVAVALSGDVGFYSGASLLREKLAGRENVSVKSVCGISSVVYLCARIGMPWQDVHVMSMHGRAENLIHAVRTHEKTFAITSNARGVRELLTSLTDCGLGQMQVYIGGSLSYPEERIFSGTAEQLLTGDLPELCSVLICNPGAEEAVVTQGLPDDAFTRADVPMTKEEVRCVSLGKLRLTKNAVVYDIGAGTGSVSVEMARMIPGGHVYAVERKPEAVALIRANARKLGCTNLTVIESYAPQGLEELPAPTHVFIGGTGGNMKQIVQTILEKNPRARVVVNTIAMESAAEALDVMNTLPVTEQEIVSMSVARSRKIGKYNMMTGNNPVYIFSFTGGGET